MNTGSDAAGRLSVVMPAFNEEKTIDHIIDVVLARPEVGELIIVNDASTDGTAEKLRRRADDPRIRICHQPRNLGKGAAVTRGFSEAACDFVIIQDADNEYDPADYAVVLEPLLNGQADVVYGSRFMGTPGMARYFRHEMGNKVLTLFSNFASDVHLSDMETCYKAFRREVIQNLNLESRRFGIEVEITAKLAACRCLRIWQVPISYRPRRYDEGKKIGWKDGVAALWHIFHYNVLADYRKFYRRDWEEVLASRPQVTEKSPVTDIFLEQEMTDMAAERRPEAPEMTERPPREDAADD